MTSIVLLVAVVILISLYVTWTAGRLDRMHARVDASWAALETQLVRRAAAARALLPLVPDGPEAGALAEATRAALASDEHGRDVAENALTRALKNAVPNVPPGPELEELEAAAIRVAHARSFHNSAVKNTRQLRRRRLPRLLRLAGHRAMPVFFDIDDTAFRPPT